MKNKTMFCSAFIYMAIATSAYSDSKREANLDAADLPVISHPFIGNPLKPKSIFVFLDGTRNNLNSKTNVSRLYDIISHNNDPQMTSLYIEGVGTADDPPEWLFGGIEKDIESGLGKSMQARILRGYDFIARNYNNADDKIYIFGFSRGAHQARALAGLLAYAGVPRLSEEDRQGLTDKKYLINIGEDILELVKKKSDEEYLERWQAWSPDKPPLLAGEIKDKRIGGKRGREMQTVNIKFLGLWDTVPGSSLKSYDECKEHKGFIKKYLAWLVPGIDKGERYKTESYPVIQQIVHAVSLDEQRSKFKPLLTCSAVNKHRTTVTENWFSGAHSDVGGGYEGDCDKRACLSNISLNWMIGLLKESYQFSAPQLPEDVGSLAHWSIGDHPGNIGSSCLNREPKNGVLHKSVEDRRSKGLVPVLRKGKIEQLNYLSPLPCPPL